MKITKYLFVCLIECLSFNVVFLKEFIFGWLQIVLYFAVCFCSYGLLVNRFSFSDGKATIYAGLITIGIILILYGLICLIECIIRLMIRLKSISQK